MDDKNLPANAFQLIPDSDMTNYDVMKLNAYMDAGLPGVSSIDDLKLSRIMELYLAGKTYRQVSKITGIKKDIILYLSHKFNWYVVKREYFNELETHLKDRIIDAKLVSQDFLLQLMEFWQVRIGKNMDRYMSTGNDEHANEINPKDIDKYLKTVELLYKLNSESKIGNEKAPAVGLNLGDGVTIERDGNNKVTITPKERTIGDMLKKFADFRREEENKQKPVVNHDIKDEGEENNETE